MMYWGNNLGAQDKGNKKGEYLSGWTTQNASRQDPAVEVYARSNWDLKTNERSAVKQMPLLGEFSSYSEWGKEEAKRWAETLYNHPVSSVVDYSIVNLGASSDRINTESGGRLKYKLKAKVEENEEAIKNGVDFEPITTEWMFMTLKARHYEPAEQPITRITNHLNNLNDVIWRN